MIMLLGTAWVIVGWPAPRQSNNFADLYAKYGELRIWLVCVASALGLALIPAVACRAIGRRTTLTQYLSTVTVAFAMVLLVLLAAKNVIELHPRR